MDSSKAQADPKMRAKLLSSEDVDTGSPEKAYMAAKRMQSLWRARSHDLESWRETIDWMAPVGSAKAWEILPSKQYSYGTAKAFIEAEVYPDYDLILFYVEHMLGVNWAKRIAENYQDRPGPREGTSNNPNRDERGRFSSDNHNRYAHNDYGVDSPRGTHKVYLLERLSEEAAAQIGPGKKYASIYEAARKEGIIKDRGVRLCFYADDPVQAGAYLATRVDQEWFNEMIDAYYQALPKGE